MSIEATIVVTAAVLWFAHGWYLNTRLERIHEKLDLFLECVDGLRQYLYEIDPQFDEERDLLAELEESVSTGSVSFAGMNHMELTKQKEKNGKRTLNTSFHRSVV